MAAKRDTSTMTAGELLGRLRRHYIEPSRRLPGGIFVPEVGMNGGYGAGRRCDAIYVGFTTTSAAAITAARPGVALVILSIQAGE